MISAMLVSNSSLAFFIQSEQPLIKLCRLADINKISKFASAFVENVVFHYLLVKESKMLDIKTKVNTATTTYHIVFASTT